MLDDPQIQKLMGQYQSLIDKWQTMRSSPEIAVYTLLNFPPPTKDIHLDTGSGTGIIARETGLTEVYAGQSKLLLDRKSGHGQVSVPSTLSLKGKDIKLRANNLVYNGNQVNPELLIPPTNPLDTNRLVKPSYGLIPALLANLILVGGNPDLEKGQIPVPLTSLFGVTSLVTNPVGPTEEINKAKNALSRTNELFPD